MQISGFLFAADNHFLQVTFDGTGLSDLTTSSSAYNLFFKGPCRDNSLRTYGQGSLWNNLIVG